MSLAAATLEFQLNGQTVQAPSGLTLAAALYHVGNGLTRVSVSGQPRAAFCGMGVCQECRVQVNGQRRLACQTLCTAGLVVQTPSLPQSQSQSQSQP